MATDRPCPHKVGDRVVWVHRERDWSRPGGPYRPVRSPGVVIAIDDVPGVRGVRVRFDEPLGIRHAPDLDECYATYDEIQPEESDPDA